jgi:hypothetical protein
LRNGVVTSDDGTHLDPLQWASATAPAEYVTKQERVDEGGLVRQVIPGRWRLGYEKHMQKLWAMQGEYLWRK